VAESEHPFAEHLKPPQRSINTAIVLLTLALGKMCEHKDKIPDFVPNNDARNNPTRPQWINRLQPCSSQLSVPRVSLSSMDGSASAKYPYPRNRDVILGLAYFALATDILGNHFGENSLPFVYACLLAGLYHGQLRRVLQSHAFIKEAGYALTILLLP